MRYLLRIVFVVLGSCSAKGKKRTAWLSEASVQLAIGGARSGAPLHYHKAALNTLVYGRKQWWLAPPRDAGYSKVPAARWAEAGPGRYASAGRTLLRCEQRAGDVLYLPDFWGHAVLNLQPSVGIATEFASPRMQFEYRDD